MKIGIFGVYSENSLGDHYLLDGIISQFSDRIGDDVRFIVFSQAPEETPEVLYYDDRVEVRPAVPGVESTGRAAETDTHDGSTDQPNGFKRNGKRLLDRHPDLWFLADPLSVTDVGFWKERYDVLNELDLFLIGGGNVVMDLYPYSCVHYYIYSKLAQWADTPSMYYSVGAGPLQSARAKLYYGRSMRNADLVTTRDDNSLELVNEKLDTRETPVLLSADPAVCLDEERADVGDRFIAETDSESTHLGVSVVPYYMDGYWPVSDSKKYENYVRGMTEVLSECLRNEADEVTFFATNHPADLRPAERIASDLDSPESVQICRDRLNSMELLGLLDRFDTVLCTRLHSLIPTFVSNTPFIAYSYQPKVEEFCDRIGFAEQAIEIDRSAPEIVSASRTAYRNARDWNGEIPNHERLLEDLRNDALLGVENAQKLLSDASRT